VAVASAGHVQVCTSLQTDNHASTSPLSFLQAGCPSCRPTNSVKELKAQVAYTLKQNLKGICSHSQLESYVYVLTQEADDATVKANERTLTSSAGGAASKLSSLVNGVDSPRYDRRYGWQDIQHWPVL